MNTYTMVKGIWNPEIKQYVMTYAEGYDYDGPVDLACGASGEQKQAFSDQHSLFQTIMGQAEQVFGAASSVFNRIKASFAPIVAAGPNQRGFSAAESAALKSGAITQSGIAAKNAKAAVGNALAAQGGGTQVLPSGTNIATETSLANSAAQNSADQLNKIDQADFSVGRENFFKASEVLGGAPGVFNVATGFNNSANAAGQAEAETGNQISQANNAWQGAVGGILGGIGGAVVSGGMGNLGKGKGFFGG